VLRLALMTWPSRAIGGEQAGKPYV